MRRGFVFFFCIAIILCLSGCHKVKAPAESISSSEESISTSPVVPAARVEGKLYYDTGYIAGAVRESTLDGEFITVPATQMPQADDETNIEEALGYTFGADPGTIDVYTGTQYRIFAEKQLKDGDPIPTSVAHFEAEVKTVLESRMLLITAKAAEENNAWMIADDSVYALHLPGEESFAEGDRIQVWFDGSIAEGDPAVLGTVYQAALCETKDNQKQ